MLRKLRTLKMAPQVLFWLLLLGVFPLNTTSRETPRLQQNTLTSTSFTTVIDRTSTHTNVTTKNATSSLPWSSASTESSHSTSANPTISTPNASVSTASSSSPSSTGPRTTSTTNTETSTTMTQSTSHPLTTTTSHSTIEPAAFNNTISEYYLAPALPGLILAVAGYRLIGVTLFLAGGVVAGGAWWIFSPQIFPDTSFCCGSKGTVLGHVLISILAGLVGGLLARWAWRVGIFHVGMCLGLLIGLLVMITPAEHARFFNSDAGVLCFYLGCMAAGGILTMLFRKFFVILTTATAGTLLFLLGVDYFVESHLGKLMVYLAHRIEVSVKSSIRHDTADYTFDSRYDAKAFIMVAAWFVLTLVAVVIQYVWSSQKKTKTQRQMVYVLTPEGRLSEEIEMEQRAPLIN
eukprot:m.74993 g.74993  ORF g.74993 m.74993 type:complete len:405 (+) comp14390_c0_seq2:1167-2381(+)